MIKHVLLASGMMMAAPVLAQTTPATTQNVPGRTPMAATPNTGAATTAQPGTTTQAVPAQTAPMQATPPQSATSSAQATPATPVPASPAGTTEATAPANQAAAGTTAQPNSVSAIVDREFPAYDKDSNGTLNQAEFGAWMVALKTASDPTTNATSPETQTWVGAAFAQADTTKSGSLTKEQLVSFLTQGQS